MGRHKVKVTPNLIFQVNINEFHHVYGVVSKHEYMYFYNQIFNYKCTDLHLIESLPILFYANIHFTAIEKRLWPVVGRLDELSNEKYNESFFLRNIGELSTFRIFYYDSSNPELYYERLAKEENEIDGLEESAAWSPDQITERLYTWFFRHQLYDAEYGECTYHKEEINDVSTCAHSSINKEFRAKGIYPFRNPPIEYRLAGTDEHKLYIYKNCFYPKVGWDLFKAQEYLRNIGIDPEPWKKGS